MKLAIIGSRSIVDDKLVLETIDKHAKEVNPTVILMGSALGIDPTIAHYARSHDIDIVKFLPYHLIDPTVNFDSKYFFIRTKQLLNNADGLLAIWNTYSKGTEYAIKYAQKLEIPVKVVKVPLKQAQVL
jgi:nucleoside phosphorylase